MQMDQIKQFEWGKQEDSQNSGQAGRFFFNYVDPSRSKIYFKISLYKFLTKFLVLNKGRPDLYV